MLNQRNRARMPRGSRRVSWLGVCIIVSLVASVENGSAADDPHSPFSAWMTARLFNNNSEHWDLRANLKFLSGMEVLSPITEQEADTIMSAPSLTSLRFFGDKVTDRYLRHLRNLSGLTSLDLSLTRVTGKFMAELPDMPNVTSLNLACTQITDEALKHLVHFPLLRSLNLQGTRITDKGIHYLRSLDFIQELDLGDTRITIAGVAELGSLATLHKLVLPFGLDSDSVAERTAALVDLEEDYFGPDDLSDKGLQYIGRLENLKNFSLTGNRFTAAGLKELQKLHRLETLSFWKAGLTDEGLAAIKKIPSLRTLQLIGCERVTNEGMRHIGEMVQLRSLDIDTATITDEGVRHLRGLIHLNSLGLSSTGISDRGIDAIVGMKQLQCLYLEDTHMTAAGLRKLIGLNRLQRLGAAPLRDSDNREYLSDLFKALKHLDMSTVL
jgi:internalin A